MGEKGWVKGGEMKVKEKKKEKEGILAGGGAKI